jgi:hypothetical protein
MMASEWQPYRELPHWHIWWLGGFAFIAIEQVAHLVPQLRGRANFYNGLG